MSADDVSSDRVTARVYIERYEYRYRRYVVVRYTYR